MHVKRVEFRIVQAFIGKHIIDLYIMNATGLNTLCVRLLEHVW